MATIAPLTVNNLKKFFKGSPPVCAVDDLSFNLRQGEILGLLGPNGAGKTTTIRMLLSVLKPSSGEISFFSKSLYTARSEILSKVGFASTYTNLPLFLTVYENLNIHGLMYGLTARERRERISAYLAFFGLEDLRERRINALSAGQRTRVMMVRAFLPSPDLVLLDEPTASLDPDVAQLVRAFIARERKERGCSMLLTSHNMEEVSGLCDRVIFLKNGKAVAEDSPAKLAQRVAKPRLVLSLETNPAAAAAFLKQRGAEFELRERELSVEVLESNEGQLLADLIGHGVRFSKICIERPTLEDFFLSLVDKR